MKDLLKKIRKHHALFLLTAIFLWWSVTFIKRNFEFHSVQNAHVITLQQVGVIDKGKIIFKAPGKNDIPKIEEDIMDPFSGSDPDPAAKTITCWQCGKKIPKESTACQYCGAYMDVDTDSDGMPNWWEIRHRFDPEDPDDAEQDFDKDKFTNIEEYRGGSDPNDPESRPEGIEAKIVKVYRKPLNIVFRGNLEHENQFDLVINWEVEENDEGKTYFKKVGEAVRGYTILEYQKKVKTVKKPKQNIDVDIDESFIILLSPTKEKIKLTINQIYLLEELHARLELTDAEDKTYREEVSVDSTFKAWVKNKKETFKVTNILYDRIYVADEKSHEYALVMEK